ncbi:uncharacterized protein LOC101212491 isoform X2 [Cucumis sativus]|uniref:uncharacterized protein LOC101212491 isoform X2 n=1 Tax=Cucumis sativus TaxID=3659 RepID=UPI0005EC5470|nr:uncharacterized protein LOC101212491 isoform X2 [Cucumis sativus]KAE8650047.1 hypothetical protein Csa_010586 [Cucumis sativus]
MENSSFTDSQVPHSSFLHSPSSEPPDIGNWFSSYEYESPELDSNDNFGDSVSREREFEVGEDEQTVGELRDNVTKIEEEEAAKELPGTWIPLKCNSREDHRESQLLGMNQDSWCSQSLLSEPPDIGNWFSSYVYESPTLNPSQEFGYCESKKTGLGHEIEETLDNGGEGVQLNLFEISNGDSTGNRQDNQPPSKNLFSERTSEQDPKEKTMGTNDISPTKEVPISNLTTEDLQCKFQERVLQENGLVPLHKNRSSNDGNSKPPTHTNLIHKIDPILENSETKSEVQPQLKGSNHMPCVFPNVREPNDLSHNKENKERGVSNVGFITANKRGFSEATCKKSVEMQENYNNKEAGRAFACLRRKGLSDKTNTEHSNIIEVIGKWSCPQKSKPNLGPPLKQLRLERWVCRK